MTPEHLRKKILAQPPVSPLKGKVVPANKRTGEFDVSTELEGYGLQGVNVTEDELLSLVAELGLDADDAGDLVKGLSSSVEQAKEQDVQLEVGKATENTSIENTTTENIAGVKANDVAEKETKDAEL